MGEREMYSIGTRYALVSPLCDSCYATRLHPTDSRRGPLGWPGLANSIESLGCERGNTGLQRQDPRSSTDELEFCGDLFAQQPRMQQMTAHSPNDSRAQLHTLSLWHTRGRHESSRRPLYHYKRHTRTPAVSPRADLHE